jgi:hypothetical protein
MQNVYYRLVNRCVRRVYFSCTVIIDGLSLLRRDELISQCSRACVHIAFLAKNWPRFVVELPEIRTVHPLNKHESDNDSTATLAYFKS